MQSERSYVTSEHTFDKSAGKKIGVRGYEMRDKGWEVRSEGRGVGGEGW